MKKMPHYYLEFVPVSAFIQFFQLEKLFFKYDDVIALSRLVVQVWEVVFRDFERVSPQE